MSDIFDTCTENDTADCTPKFQLRAVFFLRKEMKVDPKKTPLSTAWWREITNSGMC